MALLGVPLGKLTFQLQIWLLGAVTWLDMLDS